MTSSTDTRTAGSNQSRQGGSGNARTPIKHFTDEEIVQANEQLALAFGFLNLYADGQLVCPNCGNAKKKSVVFKKSKTGAHYWKCYPCGENSSATKLLTEKGGLSFRDAVNFLLGRPSSQSDKKIVVPVVEVAPPFEAVVDVDVYDHIRNSGSVRAAQLYWATWHLSPKASERAGSTMVGDEKSSLSLLLSPPGTPEHSRAWSAHKAAVAKLHNELVTTYGMERLKACGVVTTTEKGEDYFLINADYPVIEAHEHPSGRVVGMQFRPVGNKKVQVDAHKAWKRRWNPIAKEMWPDDPKKKANDAWEAAKAKDASAAGERHGYVTPFLSLRGAGTKSLVGCGLRRLSEVPDGTPVYVIEGFKDLLAVRSVLAEGYAMPGTGNLPPDQVCELLKRLDVVVALDGDAAGEKGRTAALKHFEAKLRSGPWALWRRPRRLGT